MFLLRRWKVYLSNLRRNASLDKEAIPFVLEIHVPAYLRGEDIDQSKVRFAD